MEIVEKVLGNSADPVWAERLHGVEVDWLELSQWDAQKNRFRKNTAGGRTMPVALERGTSLRDGDILDWDEEGRRAVICHIRLCPVMAVDLNGLKELPVEDALSAGVKLGHALGNQHWPAVVRDGMVYVPMTADSKVMGSVMDTHAIPGVTYTFLAGEDICDRLELQEARLLFGGADMPAEAYGHGHHHICHV